MNKVCFFDIDGTILGPSRVMTEKNREALQALRKNNISILCTGRSPASIPQSIIDIGFDGVIASAGSYIYYNNELLYEHEIPSSILRKVIFLFFQYGIMFTLEGKENIYQSPGVQEFFNAHHRVNFDKNLEALRAKEDRMMNANRKTFSEYNGVTPIAKVTFIAPIKDKFFFVMPYLQEFNVVFFSRGNEEFINGEIILKNQTKGDALQYVMKYLNKDIQDAIAFGDSMNDYEMLKAAPTAYVSELSDKNLKDISSGTFEEPDHDGMYKKLKELELI